MKKYSLIILLILILSAGIAILANVCASVATDKYGIKLDLTANKLYQLSNTSTDIISNLPEPIIITVFSTKDDFIALLRELFDRYITGQSKITLRYIDPYTTPRMVDYYKQKGFAIEKNSVVVESGTRTKAFKVTDFYDIDDENGQVRRVHAEQDITAALLYVGDNDTSLVQISDGHNEQPSSALQAMFERNNYTVQRTTIRVMGINPHTKLLLIAAPTRDFTPEEIAALDNYMAQGGRLMVFLTAISAELPNLYAFIAEWGVKITHSTIMEKELFINGNPYDLSPLYAGHPINTYFADKRYFPMMPESRALIESNSHQSALSVHPVLISSTDAYTENGETGSFGLAFTSEKILSNGNNARMFIAGSSKIYADELMNTPSYANADLLLQTIRWCTESKLDINIPAKGLIAAPLTVTERHVNVLIIIVMVILPLSAAISGAVIYFRRRRL